MQTLTSVTLLLLATTRLASILSKEDMPFHLLGRLREMDNWIADALDCFWCSSIYASAFLLFIHQTEAGWFIIQVLALSQTAIICLTLWIQYGRNLHA